MCSAERYCPKGQCVGRIKGNRAKARTIGTCKSSYIKMSAKKCLQKIPAKKCLQKQGDGSIKNRLPGCTVSVSNLYLMSMYNAYV